MFLATMPIWMFPVYVILGLIAIAVGFGLLGMVTWLIGTIALAAADTRWENIVLAIICFAGAVSISFQTHDLVMPYYGVNNTHTASLATHAVTITVMSFVLYVAMIFIADFSRDMNERLRLRYRFAHRLPV